MRDGYGYPSARPPSHPDFGEYGSLADIRISAGIRIPRADIRIPGNIRMPTGIRISADIRHRGEGGMRGQIPAPSSLSPS